jgi:signal transduction histidine kinase
VSLAIEAAEMASERTPRAVERIASICSDGLAILDAERRFVYLNASGAAILRVDAEAIVGQPALVFRPTPGSTAGPSGSTSRVPGTGGARLIEYREARDGDETYVAFNDSTERRRTERHLAACAQTATTLAGARGLGEVLDDVALAVLGATGIAASTIVLYDERTQRFGEIGTAGGYPADYAERLEACRRRGAPLASLTAFVSGKPFLSSEWARRVLADPRWAPMHPVISGRNWGALAALPVTMRDGTIGALTAFYPGGQIPVESDIGFLSSIASLVAVAVNNYRLLTELESKAMLEERNRIARDLHDAVSQALFSLTLRSRAVWLANERDDAESRGRVRSGLEEVQNLTNQALNEMRTLIFQLRPNELGNNGILDAVHRHASAVSARDGLEIAVEGNEAELPLLSGAAELHIFRIVQEALNNVVRHSRADRVTIAIASTADREKIAVVIEDDGQGFEVDRDRPGHHGLQVMRERCEALGGELAVESTAEGTIIRASVLLEAAADPEEEVR